MKVALLQWTIGTLKCLLVCVCVCVRMWFFPWWIIRDICVAKIKCLYMFWHKNVCMHSQIFASCVCVCGTDTSAHTYRHAETNTEAQAEQEKICSYSLYCLNSPRNVDCVTISTITYFSHQRCPPFLLNDDIIVTLPLPCDRIVPSHGSHSRTNQ